MAKREFVSNAAPRRRLSAVVPTCALLLFTFACARNEPNAAERIPPPPQVSVASAVTAPPAAANADFSRLLSPGATLPDLTAIAQTGETVKLSALAGKPVVVYFYPKDDTPGCTVEAQEIRDLWQDIQKTGAIVLGVSSDDAASHKAFAEKHALPFLLLPDSDHRLAEAFGVPLNNGRTRRVSFVFARDGRLAKVFPDVSPKGHGRELLAALQSLG
jgi:peroxiredoxin Q/BCP